jgi:hypothetical protein
MFDSGTMPFMIPIVAIIGGITAGIVSVLAKSRVRELEIRERIAMIERGMVPAPEVDPNGFERRMHAVERIQHGNAAPKFRAGGIMVMSVGFGLMMMLWFVGAEREGVGVGGFLVIIGLGLFVNSLFSNYQRPALPMPPLRQEPPNPPPTGGPQS